MTCLCDGDYAWDDEKRTVVLMNNILKDVPKELYPNIEEENYDIQDGNWRLSLRCVDGKRSADLSYSKDDHTAWVIEGRNGKFVNFDIGGS